MIVQEFQLININYLNSINLIIFKKRLLYFIFLKQNKNTKFFYVPFFGLLIKITNFLRKNYVLAIFFEAFFKFYFIETNNLPVN